MNKVKTIEEEIAEIELNLAAIALEGKMLNERLEKNRIEVRKAMMDFEAALKRLKDADLQEEEDADNKR